ncbi:MAG: hypothetical protein ABIR60_08595 [Allosphingosinicella sp.]
MDSSHPPEVLRELCARLRRNAAAADRFEVPTWSGVVYELEREEVAAAVNAHVLELDHRSSHRWGLVAAPATRVARNGRVMSMPLSALG